MKKYFPSNITITGKILTICIFFYLSVYIVSCDENNIPRQRGYLRIDLPENSYRLFDSIFPYSFEYPANALIQTDMFRLNEPYWMTIVYPRLKGKIYISYKKIDGNLVQLLEDSRELAMKHIPKADAINNRVIQIPGNHVYGLLYEIEGAQTASPCQFFVTDSVSHFLRGSLYFEVLPNNDSLKPVIDFIKKDIDHLIGTIRWK